MSMRHLFLLTLIVAIPVAAFAYVQRKVSEKRSVVRQFTLRGFSATLTSSTGTLVIQEDWYFLGQTAKVMNKRWAEEVGDGLLEAFFSNSISLSADHRTIDSSSFANLEGKMEQCGVDLSFLECDFLETPVFPTEIRSCIFEESYDDSDVLRLLDGLVNTEIEYLELTLHFSGPSPALLATKLRELRKLQVLKIMPGDAWYDRQLSSQLSGIPNLRLAEIPTELLHELENATEKFERE